MHGEKQSPTGDTIISASNLCANIDGARVSKYGGDLGCGWCCWTHWEETNRIMVLI